MADGRDKFILHPIQAPPFGHIGEGYHNPIYAAFGDQRTSNILHRERLPISTPENIIIHLQRRFSFHAAEDRAVLFVERRAIRMRMMDQGMHILAQKFLGRISQQIGAPAIDEGESAGQIHAKNAVSDRVQDGLMLPRKGIKVLFGLRLLGDVGAVAEHKGIGAR